MKVLEGLYYTENHEWIRIDGDKAYVGITDYAQASMGDIVFVELPEVDDSFDKGEQYSVVESVKAAADIYLPIGGTIAEVNETLEDEPETLNEDAFEHYIAVITGFELEEVEDLMGSEAYESYCKDLD